MTITGIYIAVHVSRDPITANIMIVIMLVFKMGGGQRAALINCILCYLNLPSIISICWYFAAFKLQTIAIYNALPVFKFN